MRAVFLTKLITDKNVRDLTNEEWQDYFEVREVPIPVPKAGEVLVRVHRSPINPSDVSSLQGTYSTKDQNLPWIPAFEGSGQVITNGGGMLGWGLVGTRVAGASTQGGFWAEYVVLKSTQCMGLPDQVSYDTGASSFVNPLTVIAFIELAKAAKQTAIVHTAGASQVGKMLIRTGRKEGINVISIVRRQEQVDELKNELKAEYVLNSEDENWRSELVSLCNKFNCKLAFDALGGEMTGHLFQALRPGGSVKIYGGLSGKSPVGFTIDQFIFKEKKVEGFWLSKWLEAKGLFGLAIMSRKLRALIGNDLSSKVKGVVSINEAGPAVTDYLHNMTAGKILITSFNSESNLKYGEKGEEVEEGVGGTGETDASKGKEKVEEGKGVKVAETKVEEKTTEKGEDKGEKSTEAKKDGDSGENVPTDKAEAKDD